MNPTKEQCRKLWEGNRKYVEQMGDRLHIGEAVRLAKKQDALYLAFIGGDFSKLKLTRGNTHD